MLYLIPWVTNYSLILTRNFIRNFTCEITKVPKWRPDFKMLARKKSLKLTASSVCPEKRLSQHNNNNWPSSRTKCYDSGNEDEQRQLGNIIHSLTAKKSSSSSPSASLLLKWSTIGIGFDGAETNCRIAHILGALLMISY